MILGLTGNIGSGKTTVSKMLREKGFKIYDADLIAKKFLEKEVVKKQILKKLGDKFFDENGKLNKKLLKEEVFDKRDKLKILNKIIHPIIIKYFEEISKVDENEIKVFDIPLLFEVGLDKICDKIIVVDIDEEVQIERVSKRDKLFKNFVKKIIDSQMDRKQKIKRADFVINNNGTLLELKKQVDNIVERIRNIYENSSPSR